VVLVRFRADRRAIEKRSGWIRDPGRSTFVIVVAVLFGGFMLAIAWPPSNDWTLRSGTVGRAAIGRADGS